MTLDELKSKLTLADKLKVATRIDHSKLKTLSVLLENQKIDKELRAIDKIDSSKINCFVEFINSLPDNELTRRETIDHLIDMLKV